MQPALRPDYSTVTEQPDQGATQLQLEMLATRYGWAAKHSAGKDVAEIACGAGLGLGWIARAARSVQAGDLDDRNCRAAQETYEGRENIRISPIDALDLPFQDASLDLVLLFEAIYYLPDAQAFFREAGRVLRPGGTLLIATVNCEWPGFNPSPFHTRYFSASDLRDVLARAGFTANFYAGFEERRSWRDSLIAGARRTAVTAHLIPHTMAGKQFLKRLFYGSLARIPRELAPELIAMQPLTPVCGALQLSRYRTLYAESKKIG